MQAPVLSQPVAPQVASLVAQAPVQQVPPRQVLDVQAWLAWLVALEPQGAPVATSGAQWLLEQYWLAEQPVVAVQDGAQVAPEQALDGQGWTAACAQLPWPSQPEAGV
jgi:hypothetical protein